MYLSRVIKDWENWKPVPVDSFILSIYHLQVYYINEIKRGIAGKGSYHLKSRYGAAQDEDDGVATMYTRPDQIVHNILSSQQLSENGYSNPQAQDEQIDNIHEKRPFSHMSMYSQAAEILKNEDIVFNTKMQVFIVRGHGIQRMVKLFPKETCSCPMVQGCYHILAAKMSLNMISKEEPKINLTRLRKNARKPRIKYGRKGPNDESGSLHCTKILCIYKYVKTL